MENNEIKNETAIIGLVTNCHLYGTCKSAGIISCGGCPDFRPKNIQGVKK